MWRRNWILSVVVATVATAVLTGGFLASADRSSTTRQPEELAGPRTEAATGAPASPASSYTSVLIRDVPHIHQKPDFCGEACAAMVLQKLGVAADQDCVFDQSGLDPLAGRGCWTKDLAVALRNIGFDVGPVWHKVSADRADAELEALWKAVHADLAAGVPSILCTRYDARPNTTEHFRLVLGYDARTDEVLYHEPAVAQGSYLRVSRPGLLALWPLKYDPREWTVIRFRMKPGQIRKPKPAASFTAADYAQHMMELRKKLPGEGFTVVIQPPFVVIGDDSPESVRGWAVGTVQWAVDKLKASYFKQDPLEILDIWLFKDAESYNSHTRQIFGHAPTTPYGYYSAADRALVMNIATGGGTLVHEIVHPLMAANFPRCPAWLNEGLGSLYEQCGEADGKIRGRTNWRLAGLQQAIRGHALPSFRELCSTSDDQFYLEDKGTNYAQARYLCYYLQEHGLLEQFYQRFRADCEKDPSGFETLKAILGRQDIDAFEEEWETCVLKLRFAG
ncbi:MAG: C39 family peptidase [Pirellulales bacterium]|nr:C39 family peptidase [Pirellulales bacterium]